MATLSNLQPRPGAKSPRKRVGRGESSGWGKTSGRGHKGQRSRSGTGKTNPGFEGGQMPLHRRSPKWGFIQRERTVYAIVNLSDLSARFKSGEEVTPKTLKEKALIRKEDSPVKILANGDITVALKVSAHAVSEKAKQQIESAKGSVSILKPKVTPYIRSNTKKSA